MVRFNHLRVEVSSPYYSLRADPKRRWYRVNLRTSASARCSACTSSLAFVILRSTQLKISPQHPTRLNNLQPYAPHERLRAVRMISVPYQIARQWALVTPIVSSQAA
jgi:hypothetical protein